MALHGDHKRTALAQRKLANSVGKSFKSKGKKQLKKVAMAMRAGGK